MTFMTAICTLLFSVFSTTVLTYITMATPIGPWIGPTLVLLGLLLRKIIPSLNSERILLVVVASSLGGILATAFGFSFPTLYFLDPTLFKTLTEHSYTFITMVATLACAAGLVGIWIASYSAHALLEEQQLPFPVGSLLYKMVNAADSRIKLKQLVTGFMGTVAYCFLFMNQWFQRTILPATVVLSRGGTVGWFTFPALQFSMDLLPMLWAIGFIAGSMITVPLLVGSLSKIIVVDLISKYYFPHLSMTNFLFAFCSGMVVTGAFYGLITMPQQLYTFLKGLLKNSDQKGGISLHKELFLYAIPILIATAYVFRSLGFSWSAWIYSLIFSAICAYQMAVIAGKIGLALLGRFATFVMIPGMLLFGLDALQVTALATFVEACGGIATDALFGRKVGLLAGIDARKIVRYQLFGLAICSVVLGVVLWLFVTHFQLGSDLLFAERAQGRALLVNAAHFDYYVLLCGALYGLVLKKVGFNPMLVLGGLLMPLPLTLGLVLGGVSSVLVGKKVDLEPVCSGMFAANSLCMLVQVFLHR